MEEKSILKGMVKVAGKTYHNQITNEGFISVIKSLAGTKLTSNKITNMVLLNEFVMPEGKTDKTLTFEDIKDYIAYQGFTGNGSVDVQTFTSTEEPFKLSLISTIPADRANSNPNFNAAALIMNGDPQMTSSNSSYYISTGNEIVFSIVHFQVTKGSEDEFVVIWYITAA